MFKMSLRDMNTKAAKKPRMHSEIAHWMFNSVQLQFVCAAVRVSRRILVWSEKEVSEL